MHEVKVRILVVATRAIYRKGLVKVLEEEPSFDIVGSCACEKEAIEEHVRLQPDVIIMDTVLPDDEWIAVAKHIHKLLGKANIMVLSHSRHKNDLRGALRAGARAYIDKYVTVDSLVRAIHSVAEGEVVISPPMAARLLEQFRHLEDYEQLVGIRDFDLTEREFEVLRMVANGASNRDISKSLFIAENTVKVHLRNIMEKLQVRSRYQIAAIAREKGLTTSENG